MGNTENKEIDLLLRRHGRRSGGSEDPALDGTAVGDHLDADELSSFAEGVVPAAVRSRYVAHVADCSRCRKIVAQLTLASGAVVASHSIERSKSGLWNSIASLFAPQVIRYAVPAMSLIVLTVIGVLWFQQTRRSDSVAQLSQPAMTPSEVPSQPNTFPQEERREGFVGGKSETRTASVAEGTVRDEEKTKAKTEAAVAMESLEKEQRPATPQGQLKDVAAQPPPPAAAAPESNTVFSPKPPNEADESKRTEIAKERQAQDLPNMVARSEDARRNDQDKADLAANKKAEARRSTEPFAMSSAGRATVAPGSTGPTRTVAGRQFRRVSNGWIDSAYEPSMQTHTVNRGSEQYRALIADEPELRTIAEQLEGEVIVIWKGRAYRIR